MSDHSDERILRLDGVKCTEPSLRVHEYSGVRGYGSTVKQVRRQLDEVVPWIVGLQASQVTRQT
jgi:hypothetical protein